MNYKIKLDNGVAVYEVATEQVIKTFDSLDKARKFMRKLNLGGGFDGWTPSFVLSEIPVIINKVRKEA